MGEWFLEYWKSEEATRSPLEKQVHKMLQSNKKAQKQLRELVLGVEEFGPYGYKLPNNKHLKWGLFELRDTVNHYRYYYCETDFVYKFPNNLEKNILLLLVAASDKDKQKFHIDLARKRMHNLSVNNVLNLDGLIIQEWKV